MEAPHCIPFDKRVEIFRCLVETDKERWGPHLKRKSTPAC